VNRHTKGGKSFRRKYGPWGLIAGASAGIGRAFAVSLARRGLHLVLIARREEPLAELSESLMAAYQIDTLPLRQDLSASDAAGRIREATAHLDVGLMVYNAVLSEPGPFLKQRPDALKRLIATNCTAPLLLCNGFAERMARRGGGGIVLMSSMSGFHGTPYVAAYAASKAFNLVLAEGLWYELQSAGIDVLACCPGPTATPGFNDSLEGRRPPAFPPVLSPEQVAEQALRSLGRRSVVVPGLSNRLAAFLLQKLLPRQAGVGIMGKTTGRMYGGDGRQERCVPTPRKRDRGIGKESPRRRDQGGDRK
jgi:short-subunit dehydrogenase